jgi:hypothetical protein
MAGAVTGAVTKVLPVVTVVAAVAVAWRLLEIAAPFLLPMMAVAAAVTVAARRVLLKLSPVLQRTGRVALCSGPLAHQLAAAHSRPRRVRVPRQAALPAGTSLKAIEAPAVTVTPGMILHNAVKEETR